MLLVAGLISVYKTFLSGCIPFVLDRIGIWRVWRPGQDRLQCITFFFGRVDGTSWLLVSMGINEPIMPRMLSPVYLLIVDNQC